MRHCLWRAQDKDRGFPGMTEFDIMMIEIFIMVGIAKEQTLYSNRYGEVQKGRKMYHLRYAGKLLAPIVDSNTKYIITFMPTGKRKSSKKHYNKQKDKDHVYKMKRLKGEV